MYLHSRFKPALLARDFGVGKSTVTDILKSSEKLTSFKDALVTDDVAKKRKTMKPATNDDLEKAVYTWFVQKRCQGFPVSGVMITEKALVFNSITVTTQVWYCKYCTCNCMFHMCY